jgi:orotidine-5'-phosphate decarboxylase
VALDYPDRSSALALVERIGDECDFYKVGMELYTAIGPTMIEALRQLGKRVFLDLKFHDIPNTVRGAARSAAKLGCELFTVHASGGSAMLAAAVAGAEEGSRDHGVPCKVFAVSVLTSLDELALAAIWGRESSLHVAHEVGRLAELAVGAGVHGVVCSAHDALEVRRVAGSGIELLIPGIRVESTERHDQARVATPRFAQDRGADYMVLGRAVTSEADPAAILRSIRATIA